MKKKIHIAARTVDDSLSITNYNWHRSLNWKFKLHRRLRNSNIYGSIGFKSLLYNAPNLDTHFLSIK